MNTTIVFIDYGRSLSETPDRIFARLCEIAEANEMEVLHNPIYIPRDEYVVIRWGSARMPEFDLNDGVNFRAKAVLNRADIIAANLDKRDAHRVMRDLSVSVPLFWTSWEEAKSEARRLGCDILRRRLHHTQGKDILRLSYDDNLPRARRSGYYVQLLDKDAEFRLHMMNGKCIGLAQKKPQDDANPLIWNFENGWDIQYINSEDRAEVPYFREMLEESKLAMAALGFDFGAIDIILVKGQPYVLEINSAPKLQDAARYAKPMARWIGRVLGRELTQYAY